jgi:hypothetical protein
LAARSSARAATLVVAVLSAVGAGWSQERAPSSPPSPSVAATPASPTPSSADEPFFTSSSPVAAGGDFRRQRVSRFFMQPTRTVATLPLANGEVMAHVGKLPIDGADFAALSALEPGGLLALPGAAACKLRTEVSLRFGDVVVPTGNVAADYAGLYSLWLRAPAQAGDAEGWALVFNDEADVWGTQRDPARDRVSVPLLHERTSEEAKELAVELRADGDGGGALLELRWGPHRWWATFTESAEPKPAKPLRYD